MSWMTDDYSLRQAKEWVRHAISAWNDEVDFEFVIIDHEDNSIAGACGLDEINRKDLVCNLGYWVRASRLNLGAARQAARLIAEFGFNEIGLNRLEIVVATGNKPSQRVAESVGAVYEGVQRQRIRVGETVHDAQMFALLRDR
jgi:RimJ/RimL family protein N-acetyltransferase